VKLENDGNVDLAAQLKTAISEYTSPADSDAASVMQGAHDLMHDNVGLLAGYVSNANLLALQGLITSYVGKQGSSDSAHQLEPVDTEAFRVSFAPVDKIIDNILLLGRFLIDTADDALYNQLVAVTKIL
jgi:hypothetical protein